ncbi:MAG: hypothetical protein AMS24_02395 [Chlamydiae bacterium SM23_39]|nr:MAG: hypothetical protein AMS24_02395 [Chlamydiae bacterium SM23_39]
MKYFFLLFLLFLKILFANSNDIVYDLKNTLIKKGIKFLNADDNSFSEISTSELTIDLKNPSFINGILTTHEGGVIKSKDLRIQAKTIQYIKKIEKDKWVHKVEADGDLMILYKNRVFVGDELEYDFIKKSGTIYNGKTYVAPLYIGGEKIKLKKNGTYKVEGVSITTCENKDSSWDIHAKKVSVKKKNLLKAKKIRFRFFKIPTLWLPSLHLNLKKFFKKPIIKYKFNWDKKSGPRGSIRYQAYSWKEFLLFLRLDYRIRTGAGGAVEMEYFPSHKRSFFVSKNYLAEDTVPKDPKNKKRYRIQGAYQLKSINKKTQTKITWDKYSDIKMPSDFKSDDFEINTAKKTEGIIHHQKKNLITFLHAQPRVNTFETLKEDIPTFYTIFRPINIKNNMILSGWSNLSYLKIAYSKDISPALDDINSFRAQSRLELLKSFNMKGINFTPKIGVDGIFYSSSNPKAVFLFLYGFSSKGIISRSFSKYKHVIEPYIKYTGITNPNIGIDSHYIFSIEDGYNKLNMIDFGISNQLFSLKKKGKPTFDLNIYANAFINLVNLIDFYKLYANINWNLPSIFILSQNGFYLDKKILDSSNLRIGWTVNKDIALALECRYRSKYDFRKADKDNFILDISRPKELLLDSPLSDKRIAFLTHIFFRLNPYISLHIQSHHGKRKHEPAYNEFKIDLYAMISSSWKIRISYEQTQTDKRFTFDYVLLKL